MRFNRRILLCGEIPGWDFATLRADRSEGQGIRQVRGGCGSDDPAVDGPELVVGRQSLRALPQPMVPQPILFGGSRGILFARPARGKRLRSLVAGLFRFDGPWG